MNISLFLKKNSDKILLGTGLVGLAAGVVMACKATTKLPEIKEEYEKKAELIEQNKIEKIEAIQATANEVSQETMDSIVNDSKVEERKLVLKTAGNYLTNYIPAVIVLSGSVACILGSHKILAKRYAALSAAYTTVDQAFKDYRSRVIDKYGEDVDTELKDGIKAQKLKEGETEKKYKVVNDANEPSCYSVYFDETNTYWEGNETYNDAFFKARDIWIEQRFNAKGCIFLNEVYELLGFPPTKAGQIVGWVKKKDGKRDNQIIISRKKIYGDRNNPIYLLDFNVDGNVLDLI